MVLPSLNNSTGATKPLRGYLTGRATAIYREITVTCTSPIHFHSQCSKSYASFAPFKYIHLQSGSSYGQSNRESISIEGENNTFSMASTKHSQSLPPIAPKYGMPKLSSLDRGWDLEPSKLKMPTRVRLPPRSKTGCW